MVHMTIVSSGDDFPYARLHSADVPPHAVGLILGLHNAQPDKEIVILGSSITILAIDLYDFLIGQYKPDPNSDDLRRNVTIGYYEGLFKPTDKNHVITTNIVYFTRSE